MKLKETLESYNANILKEILRHMHVEPKKRKADNVKLLQQKLPIRGRIHLEMTKLSDAEKMTLARVLFMGNEARSNRLKNQLLQDDLIKETPKGISNYVSYEGKHSYKGTPAFEDVIARLVKRGLIFSHTIANSNKTVLGWSPGRYIFIPNEILRHVNRDKLPTITSSSDFSPNFIRSGSVVNIQRDINNYIRFARRIGVVKLTTQGQLYKTALREVAEFASQPADLGSGKKETDNGYLFFLRRLLREGKLLKPSSGGLVAAKTTHAFWSMDSAERIEFTYKLWRDNTAWNGLRMLPSYYHGNDITGPAHPGLTKSRKAVLRYIAKSGTGWVSVPALIDNIQNKSYGFMFPEREYRSSSSYYYYNSSPSSGTSGTPYAYSNNPFGIGFEGIKDEEEGWDKVEAAYINHLIAGPLYWLGLVDLGYRGAPEENDLLGIKPIGGYRLTEYGVWLLGKGKKPKIDRQEGSGGIVLQPNFEILAMQPIPVDVLMTLDAFAHVKDSQQHVTTYELTRESVYRGQQGKWQVPEIIAFFKEHSKMPIPDNVRRTLEEWDALHTRITIRRHVRLGDTIDSGLADALSEKLSKTWKATDTIILSELPYQQFVNNVRKAGYLPLQTRRTNNSADNSIRIHDDGRIVYLHPVPSIFTSQSLAEISIIVEPQHSDGAHRQLVPSILKGYTKSGARFNELIGRLKRLSKEPLSKKLILNLKAWSNYYGDAKQDKLILIEFRDNKARDELCKDADLRDYLTAFKGNRPLAVVSEQHLDLVNARLKERGVKIDSGL